MGLMHRKQTETGTLLLYPAHMKYMYVEGIILTLSIHLSVNLFLTPSCPLCNFKKESTDSDEILYALLILANPH